MKLGWDKGSGPSSQKVKTCENSIRDLTPCPIKKVEKLVKDAKNVLKKYFGYDEFREGQEELINSILDGKDTVGIMPTGAGKSICFQIPALMMGGITLVISPLISLMKDQVAALNQAGIHAAYLNSSLSLNQYRKALQYAKGGRYKIIYVAPERLTTNEFLDFAVEANISMISIDEVHCVSQWGQDFRPSYLKILDFVDKLPTRPIISGFTATATKEVKEDIIRILRLKSPFVLTTGFDRENLSFSVQSPKDKYQVVHNYVKKNKEQSGIIYCLTRKEVEEVCGRLYQEGYPVTRYHAGLSDKERKDNQDDFIYDRKPIMVATNAFGMGIDKSNIRYVIHYNMPKDLESYYQEAGRGGRDGEPAECILLYGGRDLVINQLFIDNNNSNEEIDCQTLQVIKERDRDRLKKMTYYCFTKDCLRDYILRYFGEYGEDYCGNCVNCLTEFEERDVSNIARQLIGCVKESRQRFGMTLIVDTVRGSKAQKLINNGMINNEYHGSLPGEPVYFLKQVLNHLVLKGYLYQTTEKYSILKLTEKSEAVFNEEETIIMKFTKQEKKSEKDKSKSSKVNLSKEWLDAEAQPELFESLRKLRLEIAREEKVPPYIVFSDKTLRHMCQLKPSSKEEMLTVSGVGNYKLDKYGERFLDAISMWEKQ